MLRLHMCYRCGNACYWDREVRRELPACQHGWVTVLMGSAQGGSLDPGDALVGENTRRFPVYTGDSGVI